MAVVPLKQYQVAAIPPRQTLAALQTKLQDKGLITIPLDIKQVAAFLGLELLYEIMDKDMSGYLEIKGGRWVIGVNSLHHPSRQQFTIAHEIAHYWLHGDSCWQFRDKTFARRTGDPDPKEREADAFAAALLMPEELLRQTISSGSQSLQGLAETFGVSALAMKFRLGELGYAVR
jgi:Zn-dependent peptidase ImmA (M78 family)